jgi:hypothetical protein
LHLRRGGHLGLFMFAPAGGMFSGDVFSGGTFRT